MNVSILSYGASALGGVFSGTDDNEGIRAVHASISNGINYLDVSPFYGDTKAEVVLGQALKAIPRDKYFLATKTGRFAKGLFDFSPEMIDKSLKESLERLGTDYLDVLQLHDIEYQGQKHIQKVIEQSIPHLEKLKKSGVIRYYGITSYPIDVFKQVQVEARVDTMLCHGHYMLSDTLMLDLVPYAKNDGVGLIAASPLGMGLLTERGVADWHPATNEDRKCVQNAVVFCKQNGTTLEKLALQFSVAHPDIPTNLVTSSNENRMISNIKVIEEKLDLELLAEVHKILKPITNKDFDFAGNCEFM
ncbi:MAG: aldo/keto reductase [Labilibaculum sp.]|nr:aldo/keto reductase [Labilibaculum sp.]MBI9057568.1 aldo/keto reductase [Labilibaculum sp.]